MPSDRREYSRKHVKRLVKLPGQTGFQRVAESAETLARRIATEFAEKSLGNKR